MKIKTKVSEERAHNRSSCIIYEKLIDTHQIVVYNRQVFRQKLTEF